MSNPSQWTIREKVAQVIFPRLDTEKYYEDEKYRKEIDNLAKLNIGGFCIFGGNPEQVEQMVHTLQARSKTPLLMSADFENGLPMRLSEGTDFVHAQGMNRLGHEAIFKIAQAIAKESKGIGIRWNLAPVADVNTNKDNPVINIRAFGDNPESVSQSVKSYIEGTQVEKVLACAKHFPGHGDTNQDSHLELPVLKHSYERISYIDFEPFREAIQSNVASIMLAHLNVPSIDSSGLPTSLSESAVKILREELKFNGIIVTDALEMKAITNHYTGAEAAQLAINAGVDALLMPVDNNDTIDFLTDLAAKNPTFHEKIDIATRRIVITKKKFGLIPAYQLLEPSKNLFINHSKMALKYAWDAIDLKGDKTVIPIDDKINFAGFAFIEKDKDFRSASRMFTMLAQATENDCDFAYINSEIDDEQLSEYKKGIQEANIVIFTINLRSIPIKEFNEKIQSLNTLMKDISTGKKRIIINYGNPSYSDYFDADLHINTFSDSFSSLAASIVMLTGREEAMNY
ncbi:glycoside hydrolase family 3 protein [Candidatus Kapaibacterium sp.]